MSFSDYLERLVLDWAFTTETATRPTAWFVGLFTTASSDSAPGTEPSADEYARIAVTLDRTDSTLTNSARVEFARAAGSWGTITHFGVFDAVTSGNMLGHAALDTPRPIGLDDIFLFEVGDLEITLD